MSSGAVFFPPMRDINALRLSGDRLSAMAPISCLRTWKFRSVPLLLLRMDAT